MSQRWVEQLGWGSSFLVGVAIGFSPNCSWAQIKPDTTLPNNSVVIPQGNTSTITGGTRAGNNLFHSFEQFSVLKDHTALFDNASDIQNIISRVTGGSISNIDGILAAKGSANLFLINPNGIIFGSNASLNIGGSFIGSTASSLKFADGSSFSITNPQTTPLLSISVPTGLQFGNNARNVQVQGSFLQVQPANTLALVGGNVNLDGGSLQAPGGRIELGGLSGAGTVGLKVDGNNLNLNFPMGVQRTDVSLINGTQVKVSAGGGGSIAINAQNLNMAGGSKLQAGIALGNGSVDTKAGNIDINATGAITLTDGSSIANSVESGAITGKAGDVNVTTGSLFLDGVNSSNQDGGVFSQVLQGGSGKAGNINIQTGSLSVTNGAAVGASTFSVGDAGNVTIQATGAISLAGIGSNGDDSGVFSQVLVGAKGNAGNINIQTGSLSATNGAAVGASTFSVGDAGNVTIQATGAIFLAGIGSNGNYSGVFSQVFGGAKGNAGNINIQTGSLSATNGGEVATSTFSVANAGNVTINASGVISLDGVNSIYPSGVFSQVLGGGLGKAGNINIQTGSLSATNGGEVATSTFSVANAGNVTINASGVISLDGVNSMYPSGVFSQVLGGGVGKAGNINIQTGSLSVSNHATVAASSSTFGQGSAGDIYLKVSSIHLNQGEIRATNASGSDGGNIIIQSKDILLLRLGSLISTTAGEKQQPGNGGQITINAPNGFIVAVPRENSNITANAFSGSGGQIKINATKIFGLTVLNREDLVRLFGKNDLAQLDLQKLPSSSITAISQTSPNLNGQVNLNTPDVDINRGLVALPLDVVDVARLIDQNLCAVSSGSSFTVIGRGGLPASPNSALNNDAVWEDWRFTAVPTRALGRQDNAQNKTYVNAYTNKIIEAQGLAVNAKGEVILTASASTVTPHDSWHPPSGCHPLTAN